jgi:hypothetical protein
MAVIAMFYGIIVSMYYFDNRQHHAPHIHVKYQDGEAVLSIPDGQVLEGKLKANKLKLVQAWIEIHQDDPTRTSRNQKGRSRNGTLTEKIFMNSFP